MNSAQPPSNQQPVDWTKTSSSLTLFPSWYRKQPLFVSFSAICFDIVLSNAKLHLYINSQLRTRLALWTFRNSLKHTFQTLTRFFNETIFNSGIFPENQENFLTTMSSFCIIWQIYSLKWCTIILFTNDIYLDFLYTSHISLNTVNKYGLFHSLFNCNNSHFYDGFYYLKIESLDLGHG